MKILPCLLLIVFSLARADESVTRAPASDSHAVLNAVHSSELRTIMARLNRLSYEREYPELELDRMRAEQIRALVDAALELDRSAERLPDITEGMEPESEESITFRALSRQLYQETVNLEKHLDDADHSALKAGYRRLQHTCNACHKLFRRQ
ncbi:MAG: cytochrome c [Gammaproteobacteria bacterium]